MTLSISPVLIIFVVAPLAVAGLVTTLVCLLTVPRASPWAETDQAAPEDEDEETCRAPVSRLKRPLLPRLKASARTGLRAAVHRAAQ